MFVRLRGARRVARDTFRLTLDLMDPDRDNWGAGDCVLRIDVLDAPKHEAIARGPLVAALELYRLSPGRRPEPADARIMWDIGQAVDAYVTRLFEAGVLCPFSDGRKDEASDRSG
jgi:hypothetical protein